MLAQANAVPNVALQLLGYSADVAPNNNKTKHKEVTCHSL